MSINSSPGLTGFWLGWGILFKSWPVLTLPTILISLKTHKERLIVLALVGLIPLIGVLFYKLIFNANFFDVIKIAVSYNHGIGIWGYTYFLRLAGMAGNLLNTFVQDYFSISRIVTISILTFVFVKTAHKQEPLSQALTILVSFLAFTHAFAIQYLMWIIPFAIIEREITWLKWYVTAGFAYCFLVYHTLILNNSITNLLPWPLADLVIIIPAGLPVWLILVFWALSRITQVSTKRNNLERKVKYES